MPIRRGRPPGRGRLARRGQLTRLASGAALAVVLAGCGGTTTTGLSSGTPASQVPASAAPAAASSASPEPATVGPAGAEVPIDESLLAILPATVGGLPVRPVEDAAGLGDATLAASADRMGLAFVVDPASGEFAYASVIVLRQGIFDDAFFRSWRDSFDEGACSQAGGVSGHAEATLGGRQTYIGRCDGGVLTYHVRLDERNAIVSVSSLGGSRLGQQLVEGLRP